MSTLWVDKYKPKQFDDLIGNRKSVMMLQTMLGGNEMPNLLFYGQSGTGKSSAVGVICHYLVAEDHMRRCVLHVNASDERSIKDIRNNVTDFCNGDSSVLFCRGQSPKFKLVVLEEADNLTLEAQFCLLRMMESYAATTRFILTCNQRTRVLPALRSRCCQMFFSPPDRKEIASRLLQLALAEEVCFRPIILDLIAEFCHGDVRIAVSALQSLSYSCPETMTVDEAETNLGFLTEDTLRTWLLCNKTDKPGLDQLLRSRACSLPNFLKVLSVVLYGMLDHSDFGHFVLDLAEAEWMSCKGAEDEFVVGYISCKLDQINCHALVTDVDFTAAFSAVPSLPSGPVRS